MKKYIKSERTSKAYTQRGMQRSSSRSQASRTNLGHKASVDISPYATDSRYDEDQLKEIQKGLESGVDVSIYADPKFDDWQMMGIRHGLEAGVDVSIYADPEYDYYQMQEIRYGLESGVDVSIYADPTFDRGQMQEIRYGLESGVDVSIYADPKYERWQMYHIRHGLEAGVDVSIYADPKFNSWQMEQIRRGLESGVDVSIYADPIFTGGQMEEIRNGLEAGLDVSVYADPKYTMDQMEKIRNGLVKYANDPDLYNVDPLVIADAYRRRAPTLEWVGQSRNERAKSAWANVKQAAMNREPIDIPAVEEEFNLMTLEGAAASKLGVDFDENADGSITFTRDGIEIATISAQDYDLLVKSAIANSSTRSAFTKAFMVRLRDALR